MKDRKRDAYVPAPSWFPLALMAGIGGVTYLVAKHKDKSERDALRQAVAAGAGVGIATMVSYATMPACPPCAAAIAAASRAL